MVQRNQGILKMQELDNDDQIAAPDSAEHILAWYPAVHQYYIRAVQSTVKHIHATNFMKIALQLFEKSRLPPC